MLDIGQGDSILIRSPEGKTALIDAGPTKEGALDVLKRQGITHLDLVAISHHHSDHYGGMEEVVRAMRPRYFLASHSGHSTKTYLKLLKTVEAQSITAIQPTSRPRKIELGSVELTIFPQAPEDRKEENNNSVGIRLKYGAFSVLLPGDSEGPERRWWLENGPELVRDCTILKLAHHGSRNGTDARGSMWSGPSWPWPAWAGTTSSATPIPRRSACCDATGSPCSAPISSARSRCESDGRTWSVVRPALARRGRPTQARHRPDRERLRRRRPGTTIAPNRASGNRPCISTVLRRRQTAPSQPSAATPEAMIPSVDETLSVVAA